MKHHHTDRYTTVYTDDTPRHLASCPACGSGDICPDGRTEDLTGATLLAVYACHRCEREIVLVSDELLAHLQPRLAA